MTEEGSPSETPEARRARELLGEATLLRLRGQLEEAVARCQEALQLGGEDWEAYELLGDLELQLDRPLQALEAYRRARTLNSSRPRLEEKVGLAALALRKEEELRQRSLDLAEGRIEREPPRKPALAALCSLLIPGLGQIYNRELLKGAAMLCVSLILLAGMFLSALRGLSDLSRSGAAVELGTVFSLFFRGGTLLLTLLAAGVWILSIIDAAFQASKTMTSDETGMV